MDIHSKHFHALNRDKRSYNLTVVNFVVLFKLFVSEIFNEVKKTAKNVKTKVTLKKNFPSKHYKVHCHISSYLP